MIPFEGSIDATSALQIVSWESHDTFLGFLWDFKPKALVNLGESTAH